MMNMILIAALIVFVILESITTEKEWFGWSTLLFLVCGVGAYWFDFHGFGMWLKTHLLQALLFSIVYLAAGVVWSFVKWVLFCFRALEKRKNQKALHPTSFHSYSAKKPQVSENKERIVGWMCFWPFSLIGTLINDAVSRFFNFLFERLRALYQGVSDKIFAEFEKKDDDEHESKGNDENFSS